MVADMEARRQAGQLQNQEAAEAEEEAAALSEAPTAQVISVQTNEVAQKNAQIEI